MRKYTVRHNAEYLNDMAGCACTLNYHWTFIVVCWQLRKTAFKVRMKEINEIVLEMPLFYARKYDLIRGRNFYMCNWGLRSVLRLVSNHSSSGMRLMSDEAKSYVRHSVTRSLTKFFSMRFDCLLALVTAVTVTGAAKSSLRPVSTQL